MLVVFAYALKLFVIDENLGYLSNIGLAAFAQVGSLSNSVSFR
jgi:hypothetical protein